jgi:alginate O-acetyltransferase complex protein AlgI
MVFSSLIFLFRFFPAFLTVYFLAPDRCRNLVLFLASLVFYAWGEPVFIGLMLFSSFLDYGNGRLLEYARGKGSGVLAKAVLCESILVNLSLLGVFKYSGFLPLPVGISFYTFQTMSYTIDVYRGEVPAQKDPVAFGAYVSMFPQLIAGPIVKYKDVARELEHRTPNWKDGCAGVGRFCVGLGKKVLLANQIGLLWERVCALSPAQMSTATAWLGSGAYVLQLYFDFSGYSDMAVGLGRMFGFSFQENFLLPYTAVSIRDFWRKWHVSLSSWFREYVYIPLGGNRKGTARTYINLILVFFLTGIWHGAGWTFILWGFYHGFFNILERCFLGKWMGKGKWKILERGYTLFVVLIGWVIFRAPDFSYALDYIRYMFVPHESVLRIERFFDTKLILYMVIAILGSGMIQSMLKRKKIRIAGDSGISLVGMAGYMAVLWISLMLLVNDTYNPFIYFRF